MVHRREYLPYSRQWIDEEDIQSVVNILKSDYLTTGPAVEKFERAIAEYVGADYAVAFSSGTAALQGACFAAGIRSGDEVITTPMTFASSANSVLFQGGTPVFADINQETLNVNPRNIEEVLSSKTKAIIPVHFTGQPVDLEAIHSIAKKNNLIVIEDAAHALGAEYKGKKIGSLSEMTMFSFHPVKHITTGEGGIITTNHKDYYEKLIQFRSHGITRNLNKLTDNHGKWYYEMQYLSSNYRLSDIQAALGYSQVKKIDTFLESRRMYAKMYTDAFTPIPQIKLPHQNENVKSSWHLYIIQLKLDQLRGSRKDIYDELTKRNIGVNVHYLPVYSHPYYQELGYKKGLCPISESVYEEIITLPLFPKMKEEDVKDVIHIVSDVINTFRKKE